MEMELKFLADPQAMAIVEAHPLVAAARSRTKAETTTYYDTPDLDLFRRNLSVRIRRSGKSIVQTVKLDRAGGSLGSRGEWEWALHAPFLDAGKLAGLPPEAIVLAGLADRLQPIFVTEVDRTAWRLDLDGARVEVVLDRGRIAAGDRSEPIGEVELELKAGPTSALFRLAIDLAERAPLRYEARSKAARGYALAVASLPDRGEDPVPRLDADVTVGAAFPGFIHAALRDLTDETTLAARGDIEGVHRMRAAIRKLRTVLALFEPYLDQNAAQRFNVALRTLGATLGQGRDWDVFLTETLPRVQAMEQGGGVSVLRTPAETRRTEAHAAIASALGGPGPTGLILGLGAWTVDDRWLRGVVPEARFTDLVADLLDGLDKKARRRGKALDIDDPEELHGLRKSLKKLRYSVEYAGPLFEAKVVEDYVDRLKSVLSLLGDINDAAVADRRLSEIAPVTMPELAPAAARFLDEIHRRGQAASDKLLKRLRKFYALKRFWRR